MLRAAQWGVEGAVRARLAAGDNVEERGTDSETPLIAACSNPRTLLGVVALLLEAGSDVNATTINGKTALMEAARCGHVSIVGRLCDAGADARAVATNKIGDEVTALSEACGATHWHIAIVRALLASGANVTAGSPPPIARIGFSYANVSDPAATSKDAETEWSRSRGTTLDVLRLLIHAGADVTAADRKGDTALHKACHFGHFQAVITLLEAGADGQSRSVPQDAPQDASDAVSYAASPLALAQKPLHPKHGCPIGKERCVKLLQYGNSRWLGLRWSPQSNASFPPEIRNRVFVTVKVGYALARQLLPLARRHELIEVWLALLMPRVLHFGVASTGTVIDFTDTA